MPNAILLVLEMKYINHSIKRSYVPSPSNWDERASKRATWKVQELMIAAKIVMGDARINSCSHDSSVRCFHYIPPDRNTDLENSETREGVCYLCRIFSRVTVNIINIDYHSARII